MNDKSAEKVVLKPGTQLNPVSLEAALAFHQKAQDLLAARKFEPAIAFFSVAYHTREKLLGPIDTNTWASLKGLAEATYGTGRFKEALPLLLELRTTTTNLFHGEVNEESLSVNRMLTTVNQMIDRSAAAEEKVAQMSDNQPKAPPADATRDETPEEIAKMQEIIASSQKANAEYQSEQAHQTEEQIKTDPYMQSLLKLAHLSEREIKTPVMSNQWKLEPATRQQYENATRAVLQGFTEKDSEAARILVSNGFFGSPTQDPEAWLRQQWESANSKFKSGASFAQMLDMKSRFGAFQVVPSSVETSTATMVDAGLNLKGLVFERELRLQRALAGSSDPGIQGLRQQLWEIQSSLSQMRPPEGAGFALPRRTSGGAIGTNEWSKTAQNFSEMNEWRRSFQKLRETEAKLRSLGLALPNAAGPKLTRAKQISAELPDDAVFVDYLRYGRDLGGTNQIKPWYGASLVVRGQPPRWKALGSADEIDLLIRRYADFVRRRQDTAPRDEEFKKLLQSLAERLWNPIEAEFPGTIRRVMICPDSQIHLVSFASLMKETNFLGEQYFFENRVSGRSLLAKALVVGGPHDICVYANPDFDTALKSGDERARSGGFSPLASLRSFRGNRPVMRLEPLPGTMVEAEDLQRIVSNSTKNPVRVVSGKDATEASLNRVDSPYVLVLATHGFSLPSVKPEITNLSAVFTQLVNPEQESVEMPLCRSGIALAGANQTLGEWKGQAVPPPGEDGILTAMEAANLNLRSTWLVVLSACDTVRGGSADGETPLCVKMGFLQAGARNVLFSLWRLDDTYTSSFMQRFFGDALKSGDASGVLARLQAAELKRLRITPGVNPIWQAVRLAGPFVLDTDEPAH